MDNIQREKTIYLYQCALDRGDLDTVGHIYEEASHDETLVAMIDEVHASMISEEDRELIEAMTQDFYEVLRTYGITVKPS
jgi:hypothetical protein